MADQGQSRGFADDVEGGVDEGEELAGGWREGVVWRLGRSSPARVVETSNALLAFGGFFDSVVGLPRSQRQRTCHPERSSLLGCGVEGSPSGRTHAAFLVVALSFGGFFDSLRSLRMTGIGWLRHSKGRRRPAAWRCSE